MPFDYCHPCMQKKTVTAMLVRLTPVILLFVAALQLQLVQGDSHTTTVDCPDGEPACICPQEAEVCEFTLKLEERHTFTSYQFNEDGKEILLEGSSYFLDGTGYHSAIDDADLDLTCNFPGQVLTQDGHFTNRSCSVPITVDGESYRSVITVNGQMPGPTLVMNYGQTVVVHVLNHLTCDAITIHWHGLYQRGTPWMDGIGYVTQPPIDPGANFDYIFVAQPSGTFWYHSHVGPQRTDGMFGGMVVLDDPDYYQGTVIPMLGFGDTIVDEPETHTLTLIDWQRESSLDIFIQQNTSLRFFPDKQPLAVPTDQDVPYGGTTTADGVGTGDHPFWSGLINGKGLIIRDLDTTLAPLSIFGVSAGSHYRFRVVGAQNVFALMLSIDRHVLTVIATDGKYTQPHDVEYIVVHAGERYDFLVDTTGENPLQQNYWIRAETLEVGLPVGEEHSARAILTYGDPSDLADDWTTGYSSVQDVRHVCTVSAPCRVLNCPFEDFVEDSNMMCVSLTDLSALVPLTGDDRLEFPVDEEDTDCADCMHFLNFAAHGSGGERSINARSFQFPPLSYQTNCEQYEDDIDSMTVNTCNENCNAMDDDLEGCRCIHVVELVGDKVFADVEESEDFETIVLVFSAIGGNFAHPIHVHGHSFHIVYIGYGTYDNNGTLVNPTTDIDCGGSNICTNPGWAGGMLPLKVRSRLREERVVGDAIQKDTVIVPAGGYVVVAFPANNPGYWFLHCHIEPHQIQGMALILQEYPPGQHRAPPPGINLHGSFLWDVNDFESFQNDAVTCADDVGDQDGDDDTVCISKAAFVVMIVIIVVLALIVPVLIGGNVGYVIYNSRRSSSSSKDEMQLTKQ